MTESTLQQQVIQWFSLICRQYGFVAFAPMNEGVPSIMNHYQVPQKQQVMMMSFMSKMGFLPGVSDLIIGHNGKMYCLELKIGSGKQSKAQKLFEANCRKCGIEYRVAWSFEEVQGIMKMWGIVK